MTVTKTDKRFDKSLHKKGLEGRDSLHLVQGIENECCLVRMVRLYCF